MSYAPHLRWRQATVTGRRTAVVWVLVDVHFPAAARIVMVLDNLNTHRLRPLYTACPAAAHRIARRLDLHRQRCLVPAGPSLPHPLV